MTRTQLIYRALRNLGALPQGQTPSDEERDSIDDLIGPLFAQLKKLEIVTVRNPDDIEDELFLDLGHLLADAARAEFGSLGTSDASELAALAEKSKLNLKTITSRRPTYATQTVDHF